jgi:hypothetical protein
MANLENYNDYEDEILEDAVLEAKDDEDEDEDEKSEKTKSKKKDDEDDGEDEDKEVSEGAQIASNAPGNRTMSAKKDKLNRQKLAAPRHFRQPGQSSKSDLRDLAASATAQFLGKGGKIRKEEFDDELDEETLAASSLKPGARRVSDDKAITSSKISMMQHMMGTMNSMNKGDLVDFFNKTMSQFGPNKDWGVGNKSGENQASIDTTIGKGPKTKDPMPKLKKLNVREDIDTIFEGQDLTEEFKDDVATLFEGAVNARLIAETARLDEDYESKYLEDIRVFTEEMVSKLDTYLDYVAEQWMRSNEVAVESTLRNELAEEFIVGLKGLFAEHYIDVPENKVDVLEAMAEKVAVLEEKLDNTISENMELKGILIEEQRQAIAEELASDLALTQQEKFAALIEGIEFDGDLDVYANKLQTIKENYFVNETPVHSSNIEEETFEGEVGAVTHGIDPSVNRYVQAIAKTIKK